MIRPEDARIQKMMEAFEALGLSTAEAESVEAFLQGEAGQKVPELTFRNLENLPGDVEKKLSDLVNSLVTKKRYEEAGKLCQVLFALGQSTCWSLLNGSPALFRAGEIREQSGLEPEKLAAVYAKAIGGNMWHYRVYQLESLYEVAGSEPEHLKKALVYEKGTSADGKLILLAVYFWKQYPLRRADRTKLSVQDGQKKAGIFGSLARLLGGREETGSQIRPEGQTVKWENGDAPLMEIYEDIIAHNIGKLFVPGQGSGSGLLTDAQVAQLRKGEVSEQMLEQVRGAAYNEKLFRLLGGCAYLNYELSPVFRAAVTLCAAAGAKATLDMFVALDGRNALKEHGGSFDSIFRIPPIELISWAAEKGNSWGNAVAQDVTDRILKEQFFKNRDIYLEYRKKASLDGSNRMLEVIKTADAGLYKRMVETGADAQKDKVIRELVSRIALKNEAAAYLRGEKQIQEMYLIADSLNTTGKYGGGNEWKALSGYYKSYRDEDFYQRAMVLMALCEMSYFFRQPLYNHIEKEAKKVFESLRGGGMDIAHQLHTFVIMNDAFYADTDKEKLLGAVKSIFLQYLQEKPEETKKAFAEAEAYGRYFGLCVLEQHPDAYQTEILGFSQDTAKIVREKLEEILKKTKWHAKISALLESKKAAERELAVRVLLFWNQPEDLKLLQNHLETEKNTKVRNLLESVFQSDSAENGVIREEKVLTREELVKNLHKGGKKRSLAWAYETPFSEVHRKSGEPATEEYLQAILLCYVSMTAPGVSRDAEILAGDINEAELAVYMNELFDKWMELGAEAKKHWVMYAASIHGGSDIVKKLYHRIQEWPQNARGAIAADAVQALALSPQPQALLLVDGIARKFKFKQVKAAAGKALEFAAAQLGLSREELEDRIVPDFGFDEKMERSFDYGTRSFMVTITPAMEIEVYGDDGKKLKSLPAPGKKDDEEKANAAYEAFKEMKKQIKTTVSSQKNRLEAALSTERLWKVDAWKELFVKNPVMHQFAIGLIWGLYEQQKLIQSFRYMEDGSFNTEDEEEYMLPPEGMIGLVHPIELSPESREAWKQQLEDYEIKQPIEQLGREIFYRTEEEMKAMDLERFGGIYVNDLSLNGKLQQLGWYRGSVQDAGCFDTFYREDTGLGLGVELHFSGTYVACEGEEVTVYEARFYHAGTITRGSYVYEVAEGEKQIPLKDIPERYFSEIVLQLTKATASGKERDQNWKKHK